MGELSKDTQKVTIWTRQDIRSLEDLKKEGVFRAKKEYIEEQYEDIAEHYIKLYRWFTQVASKKVPRPDGVEFPIWCSISYESMLRPTIDTVCYELEVDKSQVIYFDGAKWDYVLNHRYLPKDEEDNKKYLEEMKKKGFKEIDIYSFIDGKYSYLYPLEKKRVMDSWLRIFEIDKWNIFTVQANIWEIRPEMIRNILYYDK